MLVVAGVSEAWDQLKPDFVQRLSLPPVMMPSLDAKQAQAIIAVWLADDPKNFKESQIFHFSKDSISEIVKLSRGNLRSIISLCFNCFQLARPKELRISLAIVRKAAQSLEALYSRATVLEEIERYLRASRFSFERRATVAGDSQDIVVPNSSAPRVVINVMEPIFLEDEARDAHMHAASAQKLRVEFPKIEYVLVDVGYRSGEVEEILRPPLIDFYVRYDPERFRGEFDGILEAIRNPIDSSDLKQVALENTEINQSIRQLQDLVVARTDQQARIDERIAEMLKSIGSPVINVQNTTEREPTFRTLMSWRYLPIIGVALLGFLFIALFFPFFIQNEQNQIARLQTAVERSIQYVDKGTAEPLRLAHNEIDSFLSK